jgi:polyphosphate glucokinase
MDALGIDVGGSGIKGAPVDMTTGKLRTERFRIPTPQPATPAAMMEIMAEIVRHFDWSGPIGCGFPAVIRGGTAHTAANIDPAWIGTPIEAELARLLGRPVKVLNDADAAGIAEMRWGAGVEWTGEGSGVVLILTFGTGIGSALFVDGRLVPNTEFGHIEVRGKEGEHRAADSVRERKELSWKQWARRVDEYIDHLERLVWPDLIIVGGGVSANADKFLPLLTTRAKIVPAQMRNNAGIAGAALASLRQAQLSQAAVAADSPS